MWAVLITQAVARYYYCSKNFTFRRLFVKANDYVGHVMLTGLCITKKFDLWVKRGLYAL